ncbi:hypothetical protein TNCV_3621781 [Trichonephila clavipes]|nr:hypothetical protein TNCV_3621781 [Trichonephila clavipes]
MSGDLNDQSIRRISSLSRNPSTRRALCGHALSSIKIEPHTPLKRRIKDSRPHSYTSHQLQSMFQRHEEVCQVIYSQFGLAIHQKDHTARRRFVECAQNEIDVVPDFHKRILFSDEAHFWLNGYVNKQNCRIWSEANPQVYVETPLHPEKQRLKLMGWWNHWSVLLQKR